MRRQRPTTDILTRQQLIAAATKALSNARELIDDALLLLRHHRWSRALFLAQIAGEEIGKHMNALALIADSALGRANWKRFWKLYFNHRLKSSAVEYIETLAFSSDAQVDENVRSLPKRVELLEEAKLMALYKRHSPGLLRSTIRISQCRNGKVSSQLSAETF